MGADSMNKEKVDSLLKELEIDDIKIHSELLKQPKAYLKWAIRAARAGRRLRTVQAQTKVVAAEMMKEIRDKHRQEHGKDIPVTARLQDTELPLNDTYMEQLKSQSLMEEEYDILLGAREAFRQRKDMLVTYGNLVRDEMKSEVHIRERKEDE